MSLAYYWIVQLGYLALSHAAPTIAPKVSSEDQNLAEVMQYIYTLHKY